MVGAVIDTCIKIVLQYHNILHGFCTGRRTGTTIMELKHAQYLAIMDQDPLFLIFNYLRKYYNNPNHVRMLQTLAGYSVGPKLWGLLA